MPTVYNFIRIFCDVDIYFLTNDIFQTSCFRSVEVPNLFSPFFAKVHCGKSLFNVDVLTEHVISISCGLLPYF